MVLPSLFPMHINWQYFELLFEETINNNKLHDHCGSLIQANLLRCQSFQSVRKGLSQSTETRKSHQKQLRGLNSRNEECYFCSVDSLLSDGDPNVSGTK